MYRPCVHLELKGGGTSLDKEPQVSQARQQGVVSGHFRIGSSMSCSQSDLHTAIPLHGSGPFTLSGQVALASLQPRTTLSSRLALWYLLQFGYQLFLNGHLRRVDPHPHKQSLSTTTVAQ